MYYLFDFATDFHVADAPADHGRSGAMHIGRMTRTYIILMVYSLFD